MRSYSAPLRTSEEYGDALEAILPYFENEPSPNTPQADEFALLALLIDDYEERHYPVPAATPAQVVLAAMEANNYTRDDLARLLGGKSRVSEFLNGKRALSLRQIRNLRREWGLPADALIA